MATKRIKFGSFNEKQQEKLNKLSSWIVTKREEAKKGRLKLGMEHKWSDDIWSYQGEDPFTMRGEGSSRFSNFDKDDLYNCLLYTSPSPRDRTRARMPSSA